MADSPRRLSSSGAKSVELRAIGTRSRRSPATVGRSRDTNSWFGKSRRKVEVFPVWRPPVSTTTGWVRADRVGYRIRRRAPYDRSRLFSVPRASLDKPARAGTCGLPVSFANVLDQRFRFIASNASAPGQESAPGDGVSAAARVGQEPD